MSRRPLLARRSGYNACSSACFGDTGDTPRTKTRSSGRTEPQHRATPRSVAHLPRARPARLIGIPLQHESPLRPERSSRKGGHRRAASPAGPKERRRWDPSIGAMGFARSTSSVWRMCSRTRPRLSHRHGRSAQPGGFVAEVFAAWASMARARGHRQVARPPHDRRGARGSAARAAERGWKAQTRMRELVEKCFREGPI